MAVHIPLSSDEIYHHMDGQIKILAYPELRNISSIDELLAPYDKVIILYNHDNRSGHWCAISRHGNKVTFFDPYGFMDGGDLMPDTELNWVPKERREQLGIFEPYLTKMLYAHNGPIEYNEYPLQEFSHEVNNCGYWCMAWLDNCDLPLDSFQGVMMQMPNRDQYVVDLFTKKN